MRGSTSKGVFFRLHHLPEAAQQPGAVRDAILLRVMGSPGPYGKLSLSAYTTKSPWSLG